ncbi:MAG: DNA pilot protein [Microvirus sp.]|nr:MAG: DNA pilot protein [Microvirus sp.]
MGFNPLDIISPVLSGASGIINAGQARNAFKHRYQDTVADMKKAGLNPALAYGQGGGSPQTNPIPDLGESVNRARATTASAQQAKAQAENTAANTALLLAQKDDIVAGTRLKNKLLAADVGLRGAQTEATGAQAYKTKEEGNMAQLRFTGASQTYDQWIAGLLAHYQAMLEEPGTAKATKELQALKVPEQKAQAAFWNKMNSKAPNASAVIQFLQALKGLI